MYKGCFVTALILAAGKSSRMNMESNKLLLTIEGKSVLAYTIENFDKNPFVDKIIVASSLENFEEIKKEICNVVKSTPFEIIEGGKNRQESSYLAVKKAEEGIVMIHDGARPFVKREIIDDVIEKTYEFGAACPALKITDSIKKIDGNFILKSIDRDNLVSVQTPQGFMREIILLSHEKAYKEGFFGTDDCSLLENSGYKVFLTEGSYDNIKLTFGEDVKRGERIAKEGL